MALFLLPTEAITDDLKGFSVGHYYKITDDFVHASTRFDNDDILYVCRDYGHSTSVVYISQASFCDVSEIEDDLGSIFDGGWSAAIFTVQDGTFRYEEMFGVILDMPDVEDIPINPDIYIDGSYFAQLPSGTYNYSVPIIDCGASCANFDYLFLNTDEGNFACVQSDYFDETTPGDYPCYLWGYKDNTPVNFGTDNGSIHVNGEQEKTLDSISAYGQNTSFNVGDVWTFGGTVTAHYSDGDTADVTNDSIFSGGDTSSVGQKMVTISYTENGITKYYTYIIIVNTAPEKVFVWLSIKSTILSPKQFNVGDIFHADSGLIGNWSDNTTTDVTQNCTFTSPDIDLTEPLVKGKHFIYATYNGPGIPPDINPDDLLCWYPITVIDPTDPYEFWIDGNQKTEFYLGDTFTVGNGKVCVRLINRDVIDVTSETVFTGYNMNQLGEQLVHFSYTKNGITKTGAYWITVKEIPHVSSISVADAKILFNIGDAFSKGAAVVTAHYSDDTTQNVTNLCTFSGYIATKTGPQQITVSYSNDGEVYTCMYTIIVQDNRSYMIRCTDGVEDWAGYEDGIYHIQKEDGKPTVYTYNGNTYYRFICYRATIYVPTNNPYADQYQIYTWISNNSFVGEGVGVWSRIDNVGIWNINPPLFSEVLDDAAANILDIENISQVYQANLRNNVENSDNRCPTYQQISSYGIDISFMSPTVLTYSSNMLVRKDDLRHFSPWWTVCDIQFNSTSPKDSVSNKSVTMNSSYGNYDSTYNSLYKKTFSSGSYNKAPANLTLSGTQLKTFATNYTNETYRITFEFPYPSVSDTNMVLIGFDTNTYTFTLVSAFKNIIEYGQIYKYIIEGTKTGDCIVTVYNSSNQQVFTQSYPSYNGFQAFTTQVASSSNLYFLPGTFGAQATGRYYLKSFKVEVLNS